MNIRALELNDIERIKEIHTRFFAHEFTFPDFLNAFYCCFVVEDHNGIVCAGGIRPICELVAVTDKGKTPRERYYAFSQILQASEFICKSKGFNELHAFIQGNEWERNLIKAGFVPTKGKGLVLGF